LWLARGPDDPPPLLFDAIHVKEAENHWQAQRTLKYYLAPLDLYDESQTDYLLVSVSHDVSGLRENEIVWDYPID
jgi:hypothetical protein